MWRCRGSSRKSSHRDRKEAKAKNAASTIDKEVSNDFAAGPDLAKCAKREVRMGVLTGTSMPGRRSTPVGSIILLQRAVYRSELRIELRADAPNCGDDRNAMPLAIRQYSIEVAPDSLCSNAPKVFLLRP